MDTVLLEPDKYRVTLLARRHFLVLEIKRRWKKLSSVMSRPHGGGPGCAARCMSVVTAQRNRALARMRFDCEQPADDRGRGRRDRRRPIGGSNVRCLSRRHCGIFGMGSVAFVRDPRTVKSAFAPLESPPRDNQLFDRLVRMAAQAIRECIEESGFAPERTALFLGVRHLFRSNPNLDGERRAVLGNRAVDRCAVYPESRVMPQGKPAALLALASASNLMAAGKTESCIVGGVDSLVNWYDYKRFRAADRLLSEDTPQGFIPGEGAAFIAVTDRTRASQHAREPLGEILGQVWQARTPR